VNWSRNHHSWYFHLFLLEKKKKLKKKKKKMKISWMMITTSIHHTFPQIMVGIASVLIIESIVGWKVFWRTIISVTKFALNCSTMEIHLFNKRVVLKLFCRFVFSFQVNIMIIRYVYYFEVTSFIKNLLI